MPYVGVLGDIILKSYYHTWNRHPRKFPNAKIGVKQKKSYLTPLMSYWGTFKRKFGKRIVILEISTPEFFKMHSLVQKWKFQNLAPKMP